jgi:hypothetical protein
MLARLINAAAMAAFACLVLGFGIVEWQISSSRPLRPQQTSHYTQDQKKDAATDEKDKSPKSLGQIWRETRNDPTAFFTFLVAVRAGSGNLNRAISGVSA